MINRNELRVGNFVNSELHGDYRIIGITNFSDDNALFWKCLEYYPKACSSNDLNGIELTEEWLVKGGFTKPLINGHTWTNGILIIIFWNGCIESVGNNKTKIKYIHQLQNLYFELTRKELEFQN